MEADMQVASNIFFVLAAIFFALDALNVPASIKWTPAGFCCVTIGIWLA
jgi:hypothetical protein